jgi:hypothetical protein
VVVAFVIVDRAPMSAQGRGAQAAGQAATPPPTPRAAAPIDITGNWVAVVTEDWRFRMVTPPRGDYGGVPVTVEARKLADAWDPARDEAAGEQCRSYGAAGIMRVPTRLRIVWLDDNTLRVETDAGMQTRILRFGPRPAADSAPPALGERQRVEGTWQGDSAAEWDAFRPSRGGLGTGVPEAGAAARRFGSLKVVTTRMRPGYLRKNGIPYSADAILTEYWDLYPRDNGEQWLVVTSVVHDPKYLQRDWITSLNFKKEADGSKWDPTPCSASW